MVGPGLPILAQKPCTPGMKSPQSRKSGQLGTLGTPKAVQTGVGVGVGRQPKCRSLVITLTST